MPLPAYFGVRARRILAWICVSGLLVPAVALPAAASEVALPAFAVARVSTPRVMVTPDRDDWTYAPGDPVRFTVRVLFDGQPLPGAMVTYRVGPEKFEQAHGPVSVPAEGLVVDGGTLASPGFIRCIVETEVQGRSYRGLATAGFAPEQIQPTQTEPADFDAFWAAKLEALAAIPLRIEKRPRPGASTPEVNVYDVSFQSWGQGGRPLRYYGVLTEPAAPGKYPVVLRVPGAGVRPYQGEVGLAAQGLIVLQIGIHAIPVDLPLPLYDQLRAGALEGYPTFHLDQRDAYYYLRVYLACVRAGEVLRAQEGWDGRNVVVSGGSQGGQLTVVVSALDRHVTGSVANYPAYSDVTGYLHGRAGGWPHMMTRVEHQTEAKIATTGYFDVVNFARRLRAPVSFAWGYNDETCPVTSMFAAYNVVTAPKTLTLHLEMGHASSPEFGARFEERVVAMARGELR